MITIKFIILFLFIFSKPIFSDFILHDNYQIPESLYYKYQIKVLGLPVGNYVFLLKNITNISNEIFYYCEEIYSPSVEFNSIFGRPNKGIRKGVYFIKTNSLRLYYGQIKYEKDYNIGVVFKYFPQENVMYYYYYSYTNFYKVNLHNGIWYYSELFFLLNALNFKYYFDKIINIKMSLWTNTLNLKLIMKNSKINYKGKKIDAIYVEELGDYGAFGYVKNDKIKIPLFITYPFINLPAIKNIGVTLELTEYK